MRYDSILNTGNFAGNFACLVVREKRLIQILAHMLFCPFSAPLTVVRLQWQKPSKYWVSSLSSGQICLTYISECCYSFYKQRMNSKNEATVNLRTCSSSPFLLFCSTSLIYADIMVCDFSPFVLLFFQWGWLGFLSFIIPAALHESTLITSYPEETLIFCWDLQMEMEVSWEHEFNTEHEHEALHWCHQWSQWLEHSCGWRWFHSEEAEVLSESLDQLPVVVKRMKKSTDISNEAFIKKVEDQHAV